MNFAQQIEAALSTINVGVKLLTDKLAAARMRQVAATEEAIRTGGFRQRGYWSGSETYQRRDVVRSGNTAWIAIEQSKGEKPRRGSKLWMVMNTGLSGGAAGPTTYPEETGYQILQEADPIEWQLFNTVAEVTLTADRALSMLGASAGRTYVLLVRQDAVGGHQLTFPSAVKFPNASTPRLIAVASSVEQIGFLYDGTSFYALPLYPHTA